MNDPMIRDCLENPQRLTRVYCLECFCEEEGKHKEYCLGRIEGIPYIESEHLLCKEPSEL
jgi:hypothetical protein